MIPSLNHDQFRKSGVFSIFLGNFSTENELLDFLSNKFPVDFGFEIYPPAGPETHVSSDKQCLLDSLFKNFSESDTFLDPTVQSLSKIGWSRASTAVIFYNFDYDPKLYNKFNHFGPLKFVGSFSKEKGEFAPFLNY